jgi:RNA recognition motif-containing protein
MSQTCLALIFLQQLYCISALTCSPGSYSNGGFLNATLKLNSGNLPKGVQLEYHNGKYDESPFQIYISNTTKKRMFVKNLEKNSSNNDLDEIFGSYDIRRFVGKDIDRRVYPPDADTTEKVKANTTIPKPFVFEIPLYLDKKKFFVSGKVVYSKNENYDGMPEIFSSACDNDGDSIAD